MSDIVIDTKEDLAHRYLSRRDIALERKKRELRRRKERKDPFRSVRLRKLKNRFKTLDKQTQIELVNARTDEFIETVNMLIDAPAIIFPSVPKEDPFEASFKGMTKSEKKLLRRIRLLGSPGKPKISPFKVKEDAVSPGIPEEYLDERRLELLGPAILKGKINWT